MKEPERRSLLLHALRSPRGRYAADRAARLSGVPRSTVYDWAREDVLVPDYLNASPMMWSYRDLVFLRLLARMRQHGIRRDQAAGDVAELRKLLADPGSQVTTVRIGSGLFVGDDTHELGTGQQAFEEVLALTHQFDLLEPIKGVNKVPMWGPDLVEPSDHTYISPQVMGGEPCVDSTRIPSTAVLALVEDRGLDAAKIVRLYPQLTPEGIDDAVALERRLRAPQAA